MKLSPNGASLLAPESPVMDEIFFDFLKLCLLPKLFLFLHFIVHCCIRYPPLLRYLNIPVCILYFIFFIKFKNTDPEGNFEIVLQFLIKSNYCTFSY